LGEGDRGIRSISRGSERRGDMIIRMEFEGPMDCNPSAFCWRCVDGGIGTQWPAPSQTAGFRRHSGVDGGTGLAYTPRDRGIEWE
jgi:hypothetical protein